MKILYIEDNPGDARLLQYEFAEKAPSIRIDWAATYKQAIEKLTLCSQQIPNYDLVLTDMNLPDGNGISILSFLRERGLLMPLVVITGLGDEDSAINALKAGASDYIVKRDDYIDRLPIALEMALDRYMTQRARNTESLRVMYFEYNLRDIESTRAHLSVYAPFIALEIVSTAKEILELFSSGKNTETGNGPCDILLLEYQLEDMNAIDLLKELHRDRLFDVPVIIISNEGNQEIAVQALRLGAADYIAKNRGYLYQLPNVLENAFNKVQLERERKALRASEEHFRKLIENASDIIVVMDPQGIITYISPSVERILGYKQGELNGRDGFEYLFPGDQKTAREGLAFLVNNPGKTIGPEMIRIKPKDTLWLHLEVIGKYSKDETGYGVAILNMRDVTERVQAMEALKESEAKYRSLVENSLVGICIFQDNIFRFVNKRFCEITGYSHKELADQKDYFSIIHHEDKVKIEKLTRQILTENISSEADFRVIRKDSKVVDIKAFIRPVLFKGRSAVAGTVIDVTHEKILENQVMQSQKLEAIGTLAGGIAHDFNNILSSVLGFAELATMKLEKGANAEREIQEVLNAGIRARDLVKQILTFSRKAEIKREPMEMVPLVKETIKFIRASLPATIEIRQDINVANSTILADPTQIHQILMNLCTNAAYAMKEKGGVLEILLKSIEITNEATLQHKGIKLGTYVQLSVIDNGSGIPAENFDRIFNPFFTTKPHGEGTGLGLSVVHGIVKDMGGEISVYSEQGKGTTFYVLLPLYKEGLYMVSVDHAPLLSWKGKGKILFVDDEKGIIQAGRGILEQLGYEVVSSDSPLEALELFKAGYGSFDCVLTDMTMPKMTGLDLAKQLKQINPDVPIILCSGIHNGLTDEKIMESGITKMVMKPMIARELAEAVFRALNPL